MKFSARQHGSYCMEIFKSLRTYNSGIWTYISMKRPEDVKNADLNMARNFVKIQGGPVLEIREKSGKVKMG